MNKSMQSTTTAVQTLPLPLLLLLLLLLLLIIIIIIVIIKNNNDNNNNRCVFLILRIFNLIQSFSWWNNSLLHDFLFYLNTFEHFVQNNLMSYKEETITMTSFIMFQSWRHVTLLNSLKSFNKRILGIQFYETLPATVIISDFHDGESVVIREL